MLTAKQNFYINILMHDFAGELNMVSGYPQQRFSKRLQLMEQTNPEFSAWLSTIPSVPYNSTAPYTTDDALFKRRFYKVAKVAAEYYAEEIEALTVDDIPSFALRQIDSLFAYMTHLGLSTQGKPKWSRKNLFKGLIEGNVVLWPLALQQHEGEPVTTIKEPTDAFWQRYFSSFNASASATQHSEEVSIPSETINVLEGGDARSTSRKINENIKKFKKHFNEQAERFRGRPIWPTLEGRLHNGHYAKLHPLQHRLYRLDYLLNAKNWVEPDVIMDFERKKIMAQSRHFIRSESADFWLITGEKNYGKSTLMRRIYTALFNDDENRYLPILLDFSTINPSEWDLSRPFLPQYLVRFHGYTPEEIEPLRLSEEVCFVFLFDNIDACADVALRERFCWGKETKNWEGKTFFTAQKGWVFPSMPSPASERPSSASAAVSDSDSEEDTPLMAYPDAVVAPLDEHQIEADFDLPDHRHLNGWAFFSAHPVLSALIRPANANDYGISPENIAASFSLLALFRDSLPYLQQTEPETWPTTPAALYAFYWEQQMADYPQAQAQIRDMIADSFQSGIMIPDPDVTTHELTAYDLTEAIDPTCAFWATLTERRLIEQGALLSLPPQDALTESDTEATVGTVDLQSRPTMSIQSRQRYRYTFRQTDWQDYLIARHLWAHRYNDPDQPEKSPWNRFHLSVRPQVLHFLGDFFQHNPDGSHSAYFIWEQYVANGTQTIWHNAHANVLTLLQNIPLVHPETGQRYRNPAEGPLPKITDNPPEVRCFVTVRPNREMRLVDHFALSDQEKAETCGYLKHGAGISPYSAHYRDPSSITDLKRIFVSDMDRRLGNYLLSETVECIQAGDAANLLHWVPVSLGYYLKESQYQMGKYMDEALLYGDLIQYAKELENLIVADNSSPIISSSFPLPSLSKSVQRQKMRKLKEIESSFLEQSREDYEKKWRYFYKIPATEPLYYYNQKEKQWATEEMINQRLMHHRRRLQESIQFQLKKLSGVFEAKDKQMEGLVPLSICREHCQEELSTLRELQRDAQTMIESFRLRLLANTESTRQRFERLLSFYPSMRGYYEQLSEEKRKFLHDAMLDGNFEPAIQLFHQYFALAGHGMLENQAKQAIIQAWHAWRQLFPWGEAFSNDALAFLMPQELKNQAAPLLHAWRKHQFEIIVASLQGFLQQQPPFDVRQAMGLYLRENPATQAVFNDFNEDELTTLLEILAEETKALSSFAGNARLQKAMQETIQKVQLEQWVEKWFMPMVENIILQIESEWPQQVNAAIEESLESYWTNASSTMQEKWANLSMERKMALQHAVIQSILVIQETLAVVVSNRSSSSNYQEQDEQNAHPLFSQALFEFYDLFEQPSSGYIERFLRLGLSPDACDEKGKTLLVHAIDSLWRYYQYNRQEPTLLKRHLAIIRDLFNAGATTNIAVPLCDYAAPFLEYLRASPKEVSQRGGAESWSAVMMRLDSLYTIFEKNGAIEKNVLDYFKEVSRIVEAYIQRDKAASSFSFSHFMRYVSLIFQSKDFQQDRSLSGVEYTRDACQLITDAYAFSLVMAKIQQRYENGPTRIKQGSLHRNIQKATEDFLKDIGQFQKKSSSWSLIWRPSQEVAVMEDDFGAGAGAGAGGGYRYGNNSKMPSSSSVGPTFILKGDSPQQIEITKIADATAADKSEIEQEREIAAKKIADVEQAAAERLAQEIAASQERETNIKRVADAAIAKIQEERESLRERLILLERTIQRGSLDEEQPELSDATADDEACSTYSLPSNQALLPDEAKPTEPIVRHSEAKHSTYFSSLGGNGAQSENAAEEQEANDSVLAESLGTI